jgi:hypothetical protein
MYKELKASGILSRDILEQYKDSMRPMVGSMVPDQHVVQMKSRLR